MTYSVSLVEALLAAGASTGPVLGLDTATGAAAVGLVRDGAIAASSLRQVRSHGADLPGLIEAVLSELGLRIGDLAAVAVGLGPGSFTGLRIGLSYAKGIVMGTGGKLVGVPSLDAMALCAVGLPQAQTGVQICPIIDARRGEVYTSLYRVGEDALEKVTGDLAVPLDGFATRITGEVVFVGESSAEEARVFAQANGGRATYAGNAQLRLRGSFIAALGAARVARGEFDQAATLEPRYVRAHDASLKSTAVNPGEGTDYGTPRGRANPAAYRS